jgi:ribosomal protein S27AE
MSYDHDHAVDIVERALIQLVGECTKHTPRRVTKSDCPRCAAESVIAALEGRLVSDK